MPGTYKFIANQKITGGSAPTTITFSSIPQTFNDLAIHVTCKVNDNTTYGVLRYRVNGASSAYSWTGSWGTDGAMSGTTAQNQAQGALGNFTGNGYGISTPAGTMSMYIPGYNVDGVVKIASSFATSSAYSSTVRHQNWTYSNINNSSIGAISSISFFFANGYSFADDSQITLYGIANS
jgi:hypothetical protein